MQKLLKKVILLNSENLKLSRVKFYCFYPLQNDVLSEQGNTISKLGLKPLRRILKSLKFPLRLKIFNSQDKLFLSVKNFQTVFVRYKNFCFLSNTRILARHFNVDHNFGLFMNNLVLIVFFLTFLNKFTTRLWVILMLSSSKSFKLSV